MEVLYRTRVGNGVLSLLARSRLTRLSGRFMDSRASRLLIRPFVRGNHLDLSDYPAGPWRSFNEFFTRPVLPGRRPVQEGDEVFVSPSDGYARALPITPGGVLTVKGKPCTIEALLDDADLAARYAGGWCVVVRLAPDNYHRYCYPTAGEQRTSRVLPGEYHMVRPEALERHAVYAVNAREYAVLDTPVFGDVVFVEVGALMVGRICNHPVTGPFAKGQEKGWFAFGGSTILLLLAPGAIQLRPELLETQKTGGELPVRQGEALGVRP